MFGASACPSCHACVPSVAVRNVVTLAIGYYEPYWRCDRFALGTMLPNTTIESGTLLLLSFGFTWPRSTLHAMLT